MIKIMIGDCVEKMQEMPDGSVNTVVTSPPYFGLRDYGVDGQIGLESSPDEFVNRLVSVFREIRRVLCDDGTVWLNLGDSYAAQRGGTKMPAETLAGGVSGKGDVTSHRGRNGISNETLFAQENVASGNNPVAHRNAKSFGLKHKDLIGIPWRVALALQSDGWYLRQDIVWHKPNPMPESVRDRCTKSHEYIFLLSKRQRYFYDYEAVREDGVVPAGTRGARGSTERAAKEGVNSRPPEYKIYDGKRNKRSVWTVTTKPFKGAHFATFPPDLVEPCILAGCPPNGVVLDPFGGSGTTAGVALKHGRGAIVCELNTEYAKMIPARIASILGSKDAPS